jgi:hypothetical protein
MSRRKWFRIYHGLPDDIALAVAAKRAGFSRAEMLALWLVLLDHASRQEQAGSLQNLDMEAVALQLDIDAARVTAGLGALRDKKRIDQYQRIAGWERFQSSSTRRVQAFRARKSAPAPAAARSLPAALPPKRATSAAADTPAEIAARRQRLQQNNHLIIGAAPSPARLQTARAE